MLAALSEEADEPGRRGMAPLLLLPLPLPLLPLAVAIIMAAALTAAVVLGVGPSSPLKSLPISACEWPGVMGTAAKLVAERCPAARQEGVLRPLARAEEDDDADEDEDEDDPSGGKATKAKAEAGEGAE